MMTTTGEQIKAWGLALTILFSYPYLSGCQTNDVTEQKMTTIPRSVKEENPKYTDKQIKFIEEALIKANIIKGFQDMLDNFLRLLIEEDQESYYLVHLGSSDPYKGGSGANYSIDKSTGDVVLQSTEQLAPVAEDIGEERSE